MYRLLRTLSFASPLGSLRWQGWTSFGGLCSTAGRRRSDCGGLAQPESNPAKYLADSSEENKQEDILFQGADIRSAHLQFYTEN
jgi:hypothetical protein